MSKNSVNEIENISLSAKQIKNKLEDSLAYDHSKYRDVDILFDSKPSQYYKLPFSDFKISISEELANQQLLLENLHSYIENTEEVELIEEIEEEEIFEEIESEENKVNIIEEVCEFDEIVEVEEDDHLSIEEEIEEDDVDEFEEEEDEEELLLIEEEEEDPDTAKSPFQNRAKRPKLTTIKIVDVKAVIEKIKREAREKNAGKPVIGRRQINKMLKPYMIKRDASMEIEGIDDSYTSIDIYLNAVNKIANTTDSPIHENSNDALELNLNQILNDLDEKK